MSYNYSSGCRDLGWLVLSMLLVLLSCGRTEAATVSITAPASGRTVTGAVTISTAVDSTVSWINIYIDGHYLRSGPPYTSSWNSATVGSGSHTISVTAYAPNDSVRGAASVQINVNNCAPAHYVNSISGSDLNDGCSPTTAWRSLVKVQNFVSQNSLQPGKQILFARGGSWVGGLILPARLNGSSSNPIVFGNYGSGPLPVIDGGSRATACFYARGTGSGTTPLWSYITISGFECRNTTKYAVVFYQNYGGSAGMPGIVVQNMNIHNTGPGAYAGGGGAYDDGGYHNQLMFLDENDRADGVHFLNNTVDNCGGHNCIQVQGDSGGPLIQGNICYSWLHNCIDVKQSVRVLVKNNRIWGGTALEGAALYYENDGSPTAGSITFQSNVVSAVPNGIECENGTPSQHSVSCVAYNNTLYLGYQSAIVSGSAEGVIWDIRNNILDTSDPIWVCGGYNTNWCRSIAVWDYNSDGASRGNVHTVLTGPHDLVGVNPKYMNSGGGDFRLQSGSPCINAGQAGLTYGNYNMGAY